MLQRTKNALLIGLTTMATAAHAGPALPAGGTGPFSLFTNFLQDLVDFMSGPFGTATAIISAIIGFATWTYAPKEGVMGVVIRVVVFSIVSLNIGAWVVAMRG